MAAIDHVDLVVSDFERSLHFYRGLLAPLGYGRESTIVGERGERVVYLSRADEGGSVGLRERQSDAHALPYDRYAVGVHHIAFAATSRAVVDERARWLAEHGITIESGPEEYGYAPGYYAVFFYDPDGIKLEVVQIPGANSAGESPAETFGSGRRATVSDASAGVSGARHFQFPALEEVCYLNTASIGLMPLSAQFASERFGRQLGLYGTVWFDEPTEVGALDAARRAAAAMLSAPHEQVGITTSMTEAMSQLAWSLRPAVGTNLVSVDFEFPSVPYPWMRVARETGAEVRLVRASEHPGELSLEAVAELVDEATEVVCVSHVQYSTGYRFDLRELAELCERHGAWLIVDATQSMGAVPIDLSDGRIDALVCGGYKWLCGPFGAAVCYLGARLLSTLDPPFVGWKSAEEPYAMDASRLELASSPVQRLEYSTMAYGASVALAEAIEYVRALGVEEIQAHDLRLGAALHEGLEEFGAQVLSPRDQAHRTGIVTARFPGFDGAEVAGWLNRSGVIVSPRLGSTRLSAHFFNTDEDIALALRTLRAVLQQRGPVEPERSRAAGQ